MELLNDDCLVNIFQLLEIKDQLSLAMVCQRFRAVLQDYIWSHEYKYAHLDFYAIDMELEEFRVYVNYVLPCAEVVRFTSIPEELFRAMIGHCFPNAQELTFTTAAPYMDDQFLITLSSVFPNITTLRPHAHIKGECLVYFQKVENLILSYCTGVELEHFIAAIRILRLKTLELGTFPMPMPPLGESLQYLYELEMLAVNNHEITWLLEANDGTPFRRLTEIIIFQNMNSYHELKQLFQFLCTLRGGNVSFLEFRACEYLRYILRETCFSFYARLEKMYFFNLSGITHLKICQGISIRFPALREIYFYDCVLRRFTDVLKLLNSDLDFVNFEECSTYFKKLRINVQSITSNRQRPITLNFYRNFYKKYDYDEHYPVALECEETPLFKVTQLESTFHTYGTIRVVLL